MAISTVTAFVDALRKNSLLEPAQLDETATALQPRISDVVALGKELIRRGWLSSFQANLLAQGRVRELIVGPYLLLDKLGEGGTGQVYKARHQHMRRLVALKVIRRELLSDPDVVSRFYREVEVISKVAHPHVVQAYDAGPIGPDHVLAMEYVEGCDLSRLVQESGPLPAAQACDYIRQAALGMQHIHEHRLVHRDIKPSNLFVTRARTGVAMTGRNSKLAPGAAPWGAVKILDLGLARLHRSADDSASASLSANGTLMMGTPDYLAPEQAIDFHDVDIRADIYSLGCAFYFLLTGEPPFPGGTLAQKLMKHQQVEPQAIEQRRPDLPPGLGAVLRQMMAKRPQDRFQTPGEVAAILTSLAPATRSAPIAPLGTARKTSPRGLAVFVSLAIAGLILILAVGYFLVLGDGRTASPSSTQGKTPISPAGKNTRSPTLFSSRPTAPPAEAKPLRVQGRDATRDAIIDPDLPDTKFGAVPNDNRLALRTECVAFLIRFRLETLALPKTVRVGKATLSFYVWDPHQANPLKVHAFLVKTPWDEAAVTWHQAAAGKNWQGGKSFAYGIDTGEPGSFVVVKPDVPGKDTEDPPLEYQLDITEMVQGWVDGSTPNYGVALAPTLDRTFNGGAWSRIQLFSSKHHRPQFIPKLTIQLAP